MKETIKFNRVAACEAIFDQLTGLALPVEHECFEDILNATLEVVAKHPGEDVQPHEVLDYIEKNDSGRTFAFVWLDFQTYLGDYGVHRNVSDVLAQLIDRAQKAGAVK